MALFVKLTANNDHKNSIYVNMDTVTAMVVDPESKSKATTIFHGPHDTEHVVESPEDILELEYFKRIKMEHTKMSAQRDITAPLRVEVVTSRV